MTITSTAQTDTAITRIALLLDDGWSADRLGMCPYCSACIIWRSMAEFHEHLLACAVIEHGVERAREIRARLQNGPG